MAFCEECGTELEPGARFCESCGAAVASDVPEEKGSAADFFHPHSPTPFTGANWASKWRQAVESCGHTEPGILMTREKALAAQLEISTEVVRDLLTDYCNEMANTGVSYFYLNLDTFPAYHGSGDVDSVIDALRTIADVARPKYLFIIGNEEIIDFARWENLAGDDDMEVESDLCYTTLDSSSPWDGQTYNFDYALRVGRFPTCAGEPFSPFEAYFKNTPLYTGNMPRHMPYGLSALVWEAESNHEYQTIANVEVRLSPDVTNDMVHETISDTANLLFFNLHGSNDTPYWYGQDHYEYPEAFSPSILKGYSTPYFLGVEACYGARYSNGLPVEESILMTALRNNCLAFLGSSKIAFGTPEPEGSCADIVIGEYLRALPKGFSAGDAHLEGLKTLTCDWDAMDDSDIKTMAEFALYGDPSVRMNRNRPTSPSAATGNRSSFSNTFSSKGLGIVMPNVLQAVRMEITRVSQQIESIIDDYFATHLLPLFAGNDSLSVEETTYRMSKTGLNQKVYRAHTGGISQIAKVYFTDSGVVTKAVISK